MTLKYETVINEALSRLPEFKEKYEQLVSEDWLDSESGVHIVFGLAFNPVLINAIKTGNKNLSNNMLAFLEEMASSDDRLVTEVCDFTVLEELHDEIKDDVLYPLLGEHTKEGFQAIMQYMMPNT